MYIYIFLSIYFSVYPSIHPHISLKGWRRHRVPAAAGSAPRQPFVLDRSGPCLPSLPSRGPHGRVAWPALSKEDLALFLADMITDTSLDSSDGVQLYAAPSEHGGCVVS